MQSLVLAPKFGKKRRGPLRRPLNTLITPRITWLRLMDGHRASITDISQPSEHARKVNASPLVNRMQIKGNGPSMPRLQGDASFRTNDLVLQIDVENPWAEPFHRLLAIALPAQLQIRRFISQSEIRPPDAPQCFLNSRNSFEQTLGV